MTSTDVAGNYWQLQHSRIHARQANAVLISRGHSNWRLTQKKRCQVWNTRREVTALPANKCRYCSTALAQFIALGAFPGVHHDLPLICDVVAAGNGWIWGAFRENLPSHPLLKSLNDFLPMCSHFFAELGHILHRISAHKLAVGHLRVA